MTKTTWYFSEIGSLIKMSSVWLKESNQLLWIQNTTSNYCTYLCAKGREGTALPLPGEEGQPVIFVSPLLPSWCLGHRWSQKHTDTGGGTDPAAQISSKKCLQKHTDITGRYYRMNQSLNLKQLREVPPQAATGDPRSKEQTDLLHWEKLQPPRTSSRLQGKSEHEVPPTDKNLARHEYAQSTISQLRSLGKEDLPFFFFGLRVLFAVGSEVLGFFYIIPEIKR